MLFPLGAPQLGQLLGLVGVLAAADVLAHQIQLGGGDVQHVRPGIGDLHIVLLHPVGGHLHHAGIPADAVVLVHHQVAHGQVGVRLQLLAVGGLLGRAGALFLSAAAALGQNGQLFGGVLHARGQAAHTDHRRARLGQALQLELHRRLDALLPQQLL